MSDISLQHSFLDGQHLTGEPHLEEQSQFSKTPARRKFFYLRHLQPTRQPPPQKNKANQSRLVYATQNAQDRH
jgi:hypothetical protein